MTITHGANVPNPTGEICRRCGGMMIRTGSCLTCTSCGENTGCG